MLFLMLCRITCPLLTTRSSHPSESTSTNAVPNPTNARPTSASPPPGARGGEAHVPRPPRTAKVPVQGGDLVLVVGHPEGGPPGAVEIGRVHSHAAVGHAVAVAGHARLDPPLLEEELARGAAVEVE